MKKHYTKDEIREIIILRDIYKEMQMNDEFEVKVRDVDETKINGLLFHIKECSECNKIYEEELKEFNETEEKSCSCCEGCLGCNF